MFLDVRSCSWSASSWPSCRPVCRPLLAPLHVLSARGASAPYGTAAAPASTLQPVVAMQNWHQLAHSFLRPSHGWQLSSHINRLESLCRALARRSSGAGSRPRKSRTIIRHHSRADGALSWKRLRTVFAVPAISSIEWPVRAYQQRDGQLQPLSFTPSGHIFPIVAGNKETSLLCHP
jgi:hypothetical protein